MFPSITGGKGRLPPRALALPQKKVMNLEKKCLTCSCKNPKISSFLLKKSGSISNNFIIQIGMSLIRAFSSELPSKNVHAFRINGIQERAAGTMHSHLQ